MLDNIGTFISGAMGMVGGSQAEGATGAGGLLGGILGGLGGEEGGFFSDVLDVVGAGGLGSMLNSALDKMGLPDEIGDIAGMTLDAATGNAPGVVTNALDTLENVAEDLGFEELAPYLKMGAELSSGFGSPQGLLGGGGADGVLGALLGGGAEGGGDPMALVTQLLGGAEGGGGEMDMSFMLSLLGLFGDRETAGVASGGFRA